MDQFECELCGKVHDGLYGSGRFCSSRCARSSSSRLDSKSKLKQVNCKVCGKLIYVKKRSGSTTTKCEECRQNRKHITCKTCGKIHFKNVERTICNQIYSKRKTLEKYFGFNILTLGSEKALEEFQRVQDLLREDYWDHKESLTMMMNKYSYYDIRNFSAYLDSLGILKRSIQDGVKTGYSEGRIIPPTNFLYKNGEHITWQGIKIFYRSSYELEFAQMLDKNKISYQYEKLRIQYWDSVLNQQRTAIPDFYLVNTNTIVEVKSTYTLDIQNMKDKQIAYLQHGYNFKLWLNKEYSQL